MNVKDIGGFKDEDYSETKNQAKAQDILLVEDSWCVFNVSNKLDDGSMLLNDEQEDLATEMCEGGSNKYSLLMDALKFDIKQRRDLSPVEKDRNMSSWLTKLNRKDQPPDRDLLLNVAGRTNDKLNVKKSGGGDLNTGLFGNESAICHERITCSADESLKEQENNVTSQCVVGDQTGKQKVLLNAKKKIPNAKKKKTKAKASRKRRWQWKDSSTQLANEVMSAWVEDPSNTMDQHQSADLRPRRGRMYNLKENIANLLIRPMLPGYAAELLEFYESRWSGQKRRKSLCHSKNSQEEEMENEFDDYYSVEIPCSPILPEVLSDLHRELTTPLKTNTIPVPSVSSLAIVLSPVADYKLGNDSLALDITVDNTDNKLYIQEWSIRTLKVLQYLSKKKETSFVYQDMARGKSRKTAVRFFYELLVLKTHGLVKLNQQEAYGQINFSKLPNL